ncbi:hypothetical protein J6590_099026, partial [Homalodisca vitripennis]
MASEGVSCSSGWRSVCKHIRERIMTLTKPGSMISEGISCSSGRRSVSKNIRERIVTLKNPGNITC